jgi:hypothetical protein
MTPSKSASAAALEVWAASRERAATEASMKAAALARQGCREEAEFLGFVARALTIRALEERVRAAALRRREPEPRIRRAHTCNGQQDHSEGKAVSVSEPTVSARVPPRAKVPRPSGTANSAGHGAGIAKDTPFSST